MHTLSNRLKAWLCFSWIWLLGIGLFALAMTTDHTVWAQVDPMGCEFNATIPRASLSLNVIEGGPRAIYTITLCTKPQDTVRVTVHVPESAQQQLGFIPLERTVSFDTEDWNTPKSVAISPIDDAIIEPTMIFTIGHSLTSNDANYNRPQSEGPEVKVFLRDNDTRLYLPIVQQPPPTPIPTPTAIPTSTPKWQQLAASPPHIDVLATHNSQLFAGERSDDDNIRGIYHSSTCAIGATFAKPQGNIRTQDLSFKEQFGIAATNGDRIYYSTNHGASWQRTTSSMNQFAFAVAFTSSGSAYAGTDDGVYASNDNGATWNKVNPAGSGPTLINAFTYAKEENLLWIATYGGGVWKLTPGTNQFIQVVGGLNNPDGEKRVWDILRRTQTEYYIATTNGVYKGDGAGNWSAFGLQNSLVLSLEMIENTLYAGIRDGGVQRTALGGAPAWNPEGSIAGNITVRDLLYEQGTLCNDPVTGRKALLAGTTSGIWVYR